MNSEVNIDYEKLFWEGRSLDRGYDKIRLINVLNHLKLKDEDRVLEIGCGGGTFAKHLIKSKNKVVGLDISKKSLSLSKIFLIDEIKEKKVFLVRGSASKLPFKKNSFTKLLAVDVLEHLNDYDACISDMAYVLRKEGIVSIFTGCESNKFTFAWIYMKLTGKRWLVNLGHINQHFSTSYLKGLFSKHELIICDVSYSHHYFGAAYHFMQDKLAKYIENKKRESKQGNTHFNKKSNSSESLSWKMIKKLWRFQWNVAIKLEEIEYKIMKKCPIGNGIHICAKKV